MNGTSSADSSTPCLSMGIDTYKVSLRDVFGANRKKLVSRLQSSKNVPSGSIVYMVGGEETTRYDSDHEPIFRQESYFIYLFGVKEPDCAGFIDVDTGRTTILIPKLPQEYATIMGRIKTRDEWKRTYDVDDVQFIDDTESILEGLLAKTTSKNNTNETTTNGTSNGTADSSSNGTKITNNGLKPKLLLMSGRNSDSGKEYDTPKVKSGSLHEYVNTTILFDILAECRVCKSEEELNILRNVTEITSFAHAYVMKNTKPTMYEYQSESLFRHYCYYNYGCRLIGYTAICGCGPNGATLHYGHTGEPNSRRINDGDMCLYDMGAEYFGYGSDVTCSFPVNGKFTDIQAKIYSGVLNAQRAVYRMLKPGVSWVDCHKAAEGAILTNLIEIGLVVKPDNKTVEDLIEERLGAVFMPHGLGHFVGIDTHDVGGYLQGHPERIQLPGLKSLRTARIIKSNMVLTVEPGCYFIDHLLDEALQSQSKHAAYLNATMINEHRDFGGVRLEDVVAVTDNGFVNYTLCPRTISEVEHVVSGGKWPPMKDEAPELGRKRLTDPTPLPPPPSL